MNKARNPLLLYISFCILYKGECFSATKRVDPMRLGGEWRTWLGVAIVPSTPNKRAWKYAYNYKFNNPPILLYNWLPWIFLPVHQISFRWANHGSTLLYTLLVKTIPCLAHYGSLAPLLQFFNFKFFNFILFFNIAGSVWSGF